MSDSDMKERAFQLWRDGTPLVEIEAALGEVSPGQLRAWLEDWTRGAQGVWSPDLSGPRRFRQPLLQELAVSSEEFVGQYTLWLIAARIALWTREPAELQQAQDLMRHSEEHLRRTQTFLRRHEAELPESVRVVLRELLRVADFEDVRPTAAIFSRQMEDVTQLVRQLSHAIDEALA
jgi:hypothetical protein